MELRPNTASIIREMDTFRFRDSAWMKKRTSRLTEALNIYEIHFGSFRKPSDEPDAWYNYEEMADILIPYLKENGYNYLRSCRSHELPSDDLGISGHRILQPHFQIRDGGSAEGICGLLPPKRHRHHPGFRTCAFRGRLLCPGELRRHSAV